MGKKDNKKKKNKDLAEQFDRRDEYLMLREEIIFHMSKTHDLRNMMYVSSVAILAFIYSADNKSGLLYLMPLCVVIPSYIDMLRHAESIRIISTYLKVFLEGENFNWETKFEEFSKIASVREKRVYMVDYSYYFMSVLCFVISYLNIATKQEMYLLIFFFIITLFISYLLLEVIEV